MDRQSLLAWAEQRYGTEPDYPWEDDNAVLRHAGNRKWYGVVLSVRRDRLGLDGSAMVDVLNVKCDPMLIGSLRTQPGIHPAYHMSKSQWISIRLDGSVSEEDIRNLLDLSYGLTAPRLPRRKSDAHAQPRQEKLQP